MAQEDQLNQFRPNLRLSDVETLALAHLSGCVLGAGEVIMEAKEALSMLQGELLSSSLNNLDLATLRHYQEAIVCAARIRTGYVGLVWKAIDQLREAAAGLQLDARSFFDPFGWEAIANTVQAGLIDGHVVEALSFADTETLKLLDAEAILGHPRIALALQSALAINPLPYVSASDLAAASPDTQMQFCYLVEALVKVPGDGRLSIQWAACALRIIPSHNPGRVAAAGALVETLLMVKRNVMAYYGFRALAEQHEELWGRPFVHRVFLAFIQECLSNNEHEPLLQMASDKSLLDKCPQTIDFILLMAVVVVFVARRYSQEAAVSAAWLLIEKLSTHYGRLANGFVSYLAEGKLPEQLTVKDNKQLDLKDNLKKAVQKVERELHHRSYAGLPLAQKIYQHNVRNVFEPILDEIIAGRSSPELFHQIAHLDPGKLVSHSEFQKDAHYPIEGTIFRKMVADNDKIVSALMRAAKLGVEAHKANDLSAEERTRLEVFKEFRKLLSEITEESKSLFERLLPDLWKSLIMGSDRVAQLEVA